MKLNISSNKFQCIWTLLISIKQKNISNCNWKLFIMKIFTKIKLKLHINNNNNIFFQKSRLRLNILK